MHGRKQQKWCLSLGSSNNLPFIVNTQLKLKIHLHWTILLVSNKVGWSNLNVLVGKLYCVTSAILNLAEWTFQSQEKTPLTYHNFESRIHINREDSAGNICIKLCVCFWNVHSAVRVNINTENVGKN